MSDDRVEADNRLIALRVHSSLSAELDKCVLVRVDMSTEELPWTMEFDEDDVLFIPRGPVLMGAGDVIEWHWKELTHHEKENP